MSSQPKTFLTPEQYLDIERRAEFKSEYYNGEMFAMAGASMRHSDIITNLAWALKNRLRTGNCHIYSDVRLRVSPTRLYTYPDVMVVCSAPEVADDQNDTLLNPCAIIEVLSESTKDYDRGEKFAHYRKLPSLTDYLTISQDAPHVEHWVRQPENRWLLTEYNDLSQSIPLASIDCVLPLSEIYDKLTW